MSSDWIRVVKTTHAKVQLSKIGIIDISAPDTPAGRADKARIQFAVDSLRMNDIDAYALVKAIEFYQDEDNLDGIHIQTHSKKCLPYVRRFVLAVLGMPDRMGHYTMVYPNGKLISFSILGQQTPHMSRVQMQMQEDEVPGHRTFYVGSLSSLSSELLKSLGIEEVREVCTRESVEKEQLYDDGRQPVQVIFGQF